MRIFLQRVRRILSMLSPALFGLWITRGRKEAISFYYGTNKLYLEPAALGCNTTSVPRIGFEQLVPTEKVTGLEMLYPCARPGGVSVNELMMLCLFVRHRQPQRLVEIGTADGRTTINLALHSPQNAEIFTFDLPPEAPQAALESGPDFRQLHIPQTGNLFSQHPSGAKIRRILHDSTTFDWTPYQRSIDFVFIDGAHDLGSIRKDTENALRVVRPGGTIFWHDYNNPVVPDVTAWLNELGHRHPVKWINETTLAYLKIEN